MRVVRQKPFTTRSPPPVIVNPRTAVGNSRQFARLFSLIVTPPIATKAAKKRTQHSQSSSSLRRFSPKKPRQIAKRPPFTQPKRPPFCPPSPLTWPDKRPSQPLSPVQVRQPKSELKRFGCPRPNGTVVRQQRLDQRPPLPFTRFARPPCRTVCERFVGVRAGWGDLQRQKKAGSASVRRT